ncbi:UDP-N-acetylglucosamine 2-epimerase [Caenispirillum salinarum AK4]|uniref:UDP-N-acetylglucosamine 2-epimerase n=1 Tax=Caenispirillum salinarum AK4 TaxID=1238182 RepID=K9GJA2_9PROT|nr:UDP-N-acetylglucosamine 2-epimerase [Caenispirillum salinarum]EKV26055.1 UDP-N-acetylglucosamine 2-epimerase [Caenispirillum salinarum AK4]
MKLLFLNGSRGEWGYIRPIIDLCVGRGIDYGICATNMLLLSSHGSLVDEIRAEGYKVCDDIFMSLEGHNHITMVKSLGVFLTSFVETINREKPDWVVLAGDRGEQLMGAVAAAYTYTPVCHIQAGERSGNIDGVARHAIGKFVHLHFAANQDAADRLARLGEEPFRIHNVGAPQLDELVKDDVTPATELAHRYDLDATKPYLLAVQHPVTEEMDLAVEQVQAMAQAVGRYDMPKVWILPNNDAGSHAVRRALLKHRGPDTMVFENLTRRDYLGFLKHAAAMVGNSSSGLLEAPTFKVAAVNLGRRQADRVQGTNVINAPFEVDAICAAIDKALSPAFQSTLGTCENPYGDGRSSERILDILTEMPIDDRLLVKRLMY